MIICDSGLIIIIPGQPFLTQVTQLYMLRARFLFNLNDQGKHFQENVRQVDAHATLQHFWYHSDNNIQEWQNFIPRICKHS